MRALLAPLLLSGCLAQVPGTPAVYTGELPPGSDEDDLAATIECVIELEGSRDSVETSLINFREVIRDDITGVEYAGIFWEPNRMVIATEGRETLGRTALSYELCRVVHWDRHLEVTPSLDHAEMYSETIQACKDP